MAAAMVGAVLVRLMLGIAERMDFEWLSANDESWLYAVDVSV